MIRRDFLRAIFALSAGAVVVGPASGMAALLRRPGQLSAPSTPARTYPIWPEFQEEWEWVPTYTPWPGEDPPRYPGDGWWLYMATSTLPSPRGPLPYVAAEFTDVPRDGDFAELSELRQVVRQALERRVRQLRRGQYE